QGTIAGADITALQVASFHEQGAEHVLGSHDRGKAVMAMSQALCRLVDQRSQAGLISGIVGIGGSGGTSMIAPALHMLPYGVRKLLVATLASGNVAPFVDVHDVMMLNPV